MQARGWQWWDCNSSTGPHFSLVKDNQKSRFVQPCTFSILTTVIRHIPPPDVESHALLYSANEQRLVMSVETTATKITYHGGPQLSLSLSFSLSLLWYTVTGKVKWNTQQWAWNYKDDK